MMIRERAATGVEDMPTEFLSPADLAREWNVPLQSVYLWRSQHKLPPAVKMGRHVRWSRASINEYLRQQTEPNDAA